MIKLYVGAAMIWSIWAIHMQIEKHPDSPWWKYLLVWFLNFVGFPICVIIAIYKGNLLNKKKK